MIACLRGILHTKQADRLIVDVAGVGYEVLVSPSGFYDLPGEGEEVFLLVHTEVREDAITLFGFRAPAEKAIFQLLITVSGVGPKSALGILSGITPGELAQAIASENIGRLTRLMGVGKKTAERLCLELKDKVANIFSEEMSKAGKLVPDSAPREPADQKVADVISALVNLGYTTVMARKAIDTVRRSVAEDRFAVMTIEELLRQTLKVVV